MLYKYEGNRAERLVQMRQSKTSWILGTAQLHSQYGVLSASVENSSEDVNAFLLYAKSLGFVALDTAPSYERAEETIGRCSLDLPVHTKLDPAKKPLESISLSLQKLRCDKVDIAYLHDPIAAVSDNGRAVKEAASLTGEYYDRLGTSVYTRDALAASLDMPEIQAIQIPVNPLWRDLVNALPQASSQRPLVFGRSLLGQGLLLLAAENLPESVLHLKPSIEAFQKACRTIERTPLEGALLWARDLPGLDGHIIGAISIAQLREIASTLDASALSPEERAVIDSMPLPDSTPFDPRSWT